MQKLLLIEWQAESKHTWYHRHVRLMYEQSFARPKLVANPSTPTCP